MQRFLFTLFLIAASQPLRAQSPDSSLLVEVEKAIVLQTNEFRQKHGLAAVRKTNQLTETATSFAKFMAETGKYGHYADDKSPAQRAKNAGYQFCIVRENIAYRTNTGKVTAQGLIEVFVQGWIESPPHRENMLADYATETGVAVATSDKTTYYAVQLFGRPKSAAIKLKVTNESEEMHTLLVDANESNDEIQLPPRSIVTITRCFPTTLRLNKETSEVTLSESAEFTISSDGIKRK